MRGETSEEMKPAQGGCPASLASVMKPAPGDCPASLASRPRPSGNFETINPVAIVPVLQSRPEATTGEGLNPSPAKGKDTNDDGPGYCVGNTTYGLLLLGLAFLIEAVLFVFHCTSIFDVMVDERNAREWVGVTPTVAVVAGIFLVPAMLETLLYIAQLTCWRRRTLRREHRQANYVPWRRVSETKTTCWAIWRAQKYLRHPASAHYVRLMFALEVKEFVFQALALEQMSRAGIGRGALTFFTTVLLLNGLTPLGMSWIVNHVNRIDDAVTRRKLASTWISRLLLFDATCDLLYSFFGLAHLIYRYVQIFSEADMYAGEQQIINRFVTSVRDGQGKNDLRAYMLLSESRATLFGGDSGWDIFIKVMARAIPLLQAPFRVMSAFSIRQGLNAANYRGDSGPAAEAKPAGTAAAAATASTLAENDKTTSSSDSGSDSGNGSGNGSGNSGKSSSTAHTHSDTTPASSTVRRRMVILVRQRAFKGRYNVVPCWATGLLFVVASTFCSIVYARLWSWGECPVPEIRQSCAVRAFPIFHVYDDAEDYGCRSCSCNILFYVNENCTAALTEMNSSVAEIKDTGCHAPTTTDSSNGRRVRHRYASEILNLSATILQPAAAIMVGACPSDTNLLKTLGMRAYSPTVLNLRATREPAYPQQRRGGNGRNLLPSTFTWTFPPGFGYRGSSTDEPFPLVAFLIEGQQRPNNHAIRLGNLPTALGRMTTLKGLHLTRIGLNQMPAIAKLTGLVDLLLHGNLLRSIPSAIGRLTNLLSLKVGNNRLFSMSSFIGRLPGLKHLDVSNNLLLTSAVPPSLGQLTGLETLYLDGNLLSAVPSFIGQLTDLKNLRLSQNHQLTSIPSFIGRLTQLSSLWLYDIGLTTIPASILTIPRSSSNFYVTLEANNISFAAMTAALAAASTTLHSETANPPSSLMLLGRNPACSGNGSLASRVGPWRIKCEPECALGCRDTRFGDVVSWVGDGECDLRCYTAACRWDAGDC